MTRGRSREKHRRADGFARLRNLPAVYGDRNAAQRNFTLDRGQHVAIKANGLLLHTRVKGGDYSSRLVDDHESCFALLAYLENTNRTNIISAARPLWLRHDRADAGGGETAVSSRAFDKRMKHYAAQAGLPAFHLHQLRHTYARIVSEESGSITATQDALGHRNLATTRVYVERISIKRNPYSRTAARRIGD